MKNLLVLSVVGSSLFIGCKSIKADENYFLNYTATSYADPTYEILKSSVTGDTNQTSLITTFNRSLNNNVRLKNAWIDHSLNKIFMQEVSSSHSNDTGRVWTYSIDDDNWTVGTISSDSSDDDPNYQPINSNSYQAVQSNSTSINTNTSNISSNDRDIATNASNISSNDTDIATNASNISSNDTDIATNASNISSNTSNIKNLGQGVAGSTALTAALTALPQTSKDSKLSCGIGTGAYSSRYAVGFGCASKVNERVDVNAGGSYVFGGSKSYGGGTLDSGVIKAGFVFKLGKLKNHIEISMKDKKIMETKIESLEENNRNILAQNQALLERLERLEKIALGENKSKDLAIYHLK